MHTESITHLVRVDGTEVLVHLINGIPLCREKERERERERETVWVKSHIRTSTHFTDLYAANRSAAVYISQMMGCACASP